MSDVFTIDDTDGIPDGRLRPAMQLWWGQFRGQTLGLMTDAHGPVRDTVDRAVVSHLFRIGAVFACLCQDGAAEAAGINVHQQLTFLSDELEPLTWGQGSIRVDGQEVAAATLTHRGLEFIAGADFIRYPFLLVRLTGGSPPWPALRTVPEPPWPAD
ncbi:MAG: hypothetical protein ACXVGR_15420 [Mycobacteriaceae bacterium]